MGFEMSSWDIALRFPLTDDFWITRQINQARQSSHNKREGQGDIWTQLAECCSQRGVGCCASGNGCLALSVYLSGIGLNFRDLYLLLFFSSTHDPFHRSVVNSKDLVGVQ